jgi:uncharacterized Ntn-hydrolase superfamily protein
VTFSVVARDAATGDLGCAVQSKFPAVGAIVIHARAGVGAVATQALSNVGYGPRGLALLEAGASPSQALAVLTSGDSLADRRQAGIVDVVGRSASHTGTGCSPWAGHVVREDFACQGNMLVSAATVEAMARVMVDRLDLPFPERLVTSLAMGQAAGGDARGQQSAALTTHGRSKNWAACWPCIESTSTDPPMPTSFLSSDHLLRRLRSGFHHLQQRPHGPPPMRCGTFWMHGPVERILSNA